MVGIFKGSAPITPDLGGAGLEAVYVGSTKVWPSTLPGFSQPYPNDAADLAEWSPTNGTILSVNSNNLQWRINGGVNHPGMTRPVDVTPGVEYIFQVQGANSGGYANRKIAVGTQSGWTDIVQLAVSGTDWASNSVPIEVVFTPTVSVVWVTASCNGWYSYIDSWMNSPRCEPT